LIAVVEASFRRHADDFSRPESANWRYAAIKASRDSKDAEILSFGTSLVKYGVQSRVVSRVTGKRTFNLAVFCGQMSSSYFLLKRTLAAGARPRLLLVDCQDGPVPREHSGERLEGVQSSLRWWPQILSFRDTLELAWDTKDPALFADISTAKLLASYRARDEIRTSIQAAFRGDSSLTTADIRTLRRNWAMNGGTHVAPRKPAVAPNEAVSQSVPIAKFDDRQFLRNKLAHAHAQRFVDLASQHGIRVLWLLPPIGPNAQRDRDRIGLDDYFTQQARWIQTQSDLITVVDGRRAGYGASTFADTVHLDRAGAGTFSQDVAEVIKHAIDHPESLPRWVELPPYRDLPERMPLEDVGQSRLAISEREKIGR